MSCGETTKKRMAGISRRAVSSFQSRLRILAANGLPGGAPAESCWERSAETIAARKDEIAGLAVATDEGIEAYLLYIQDEDGAVLLDFRSLIDDGGTRLKQLLSRLGKGTVRFPKVGPAEISRESLDAFGFRPAGAHRVYAATPRSS